MSMVDVFRLADGVPSEKDEAEGMYGRELKYDAGEGKYEAVELDLRLLKERLKLVESQRELAALHCERFTKMLEARIEKLDKAGQQQQHGQQGQQQQGQQPGQQPGQEQQQRQQRQHQGQQGQQGQQRQQARQEECASPRTQRELQRGSAYSYGALTPRGSRSSVGSPTSAQSPRRSLDPQWKAGTGTRERRGGGSGLSAAFALPGGASGEDRVPAPGARRSFELPLSVNPQLKSFDRFLRCSHAEASEFESCTKSFALPASGQPFLRSLDNPDRVSGSEPRAPTPAILRAHTTHVLSPSSLPTATSSPLSSLPESCCPSYDMLKASLAGPKLRRYASGRISQPRPGSPESQSPSKSHSERMMRDSPIISLQTWSYYNS